MVSCMIFAYTNHMQYLNQDMIMQFVDMAGLWRIFAYGLSLVVLCLILVRLMILRRRVPPQPSRVASILFQSVKGDLLHGKNGLTPGGLPLINFVLKPVDNVYTIPLQIYSVELPFYSQVHIVGVPQRGKLLPEIEFQGSRFEQLPLRDDDAAHFQLYLKSLTSGSGQAFFNPKIATFHRDFCATIEWEIWRNMLYFIAPDRLDSLAVIDQFIAQLRPTLEMAERRPISQGYALNAASTGHALACPICNQQLDIGDSWLQCPRGHGCLVTASQLVSLRQRGGNDNLVLSQAPAESADHTEIQCPNCSAWMVPTVYQNTDIIIDVCHHCVYRWVDAAEVKAVLGIALFSQSSKVI